MEDNETISPLRSAITRKGADTYLLITLLSFAVSISTRLLLDLTRYPRLGNEQLHISHILWGGLFLFIASLLPLIFSNLWILRLTSILSGIGVGLFIDEVGKFITANNDYFFPAAAPIIYSIFLFTVLIYHLVRQGRQVNEPRAEFYAILEDLQEVLDHDLSEKEKGSIHTRLVNINKTEANITLKQLASNLIAFTSWNEIHLAPERPGFVVQFINKLLYFEARWLTQLRFRIILCVLMLAWSVWSIIIPLRFLTLSASPERFSIFIIHLIASKGISGNTDLVLYQTQVGFQAAISVLVITSTILILIGKENRGVTLGYLSFLFMLVIANQLLFYFDQFSTILNAVAQFLMTLCLLRYRNRFLSSKTLIIESQNVL